MRDSGLCNSVCVCVCACVRACACVCVCVCAHTPVHVNCEMWCGVVCCVLLVYRVVSLSTKGRCSSVHHYSSGEGNACAQRYVREGKPVLYLLAVTVCHCVTVLSVCCTSSLSQCHCVTLCSVCSSLWVLYSGYTVIMRHKTRPHMHVLNMGLRVHLFPSLSYPTPLPFPPLPSSPFPSLPSPPLPSPPLSSPPLPSPPLSSLSPPIPPSPPIPSLLTEW